MIVAVTFDTLKFVRRLEKAGVPPAQAEAISAAVSDSHDAAEIATKADLHGVKTEMREMELRIDKRFAEIIGQMLLLKWMFGASLAFMLAIFLKLFFGGVS